MIPNVGSKRGVAAWRNVRDVTCHSTRHVLVIEDEVRLRKLLVRELKAVDGVNVIMPAGTFYVFPNVAPICMNLGITSHGLAMYLLEAADDAKGVACLGGECFGPAGKGFLRFSCAEPDDRLVAAVAFLKEAVKRVERVQAYLERNAKYRLA